MTHEPQDLRSINVGRGVGFTVALFVRDRLALPVADDVPALVPRVAVEALPGDEVAALAAEWREWWDRLTEVPAGRDVEPASERLAAVFGAVAAEARAWHEEMVRPSFFFSEADLPDGYVPEPIGDPDVPVVYDVELVPVGGAWHRDLGPHRLLVSVETWEDPAATDALLRPRIERLQSRVSAAPRRSPQVWHLTVDGQEFTVTDRPHEPGSYDFSWQNGPIEGYGFSIGTSTREPLSEDVMRREITGFVEGYEP
ncbi:hypothetical protein ACFVQ3_04600 [Oerskovia sp. NPDC057915]|uniref:hypothetical protein n=1 Tax=Oerskovia sp. NPDC057915 TaxID=3346280 RepID=UPI0036D8F270